MALKDKKNNNSQFLNENIPFSQVLLVTSEEEKSIVSRQEALNQAKSLGLDLLCVSPSTNPPVCKIVNYYQFSKNKKKPKENICKEMRISFNIGKNDLKIKVGKIQKWIEEGATVKVNLIMVGKGRVHLAHEKCQEIIEEIKVESPKIELKDNIRRHLGTFYFFLYKKKQ